MASNNNNNLSAINLQQQQDLMQVAALMFPSLFMAQQSTTNNQLHGSSSSPVAQQSFLSNLQMQQQINDQQTKLLESLGDQQQSSDWLKILNGQAKNNSSATTTNNSHNSNGGGLNHRQATIIQNNKNKINHLTSNGSTKPQSNKIIAFNTNSSTDEKKAQSTITNGTNGSSRPSSKIISQISQRASSNSNHISSITGSASKPSSSASPGPTNSQQATTKTKTGSNVFSIKDLISAGGSATTVTTKKIEQQDNTNKYLECLLLAQTKENPSQASNNVNANNNSNDQLLMFAAAAAAMQNSSTNNFFVAKNQTNVINNNSQPHNNNNNNNNNSINSYDWLMQIASQQQQQQQLQQPQVLFNNSNKLSSESCVASSSHKQPKSSNLKINSLNLNGSHHHGVKNEKIMNNHVTNATNENSQESSFDLYEAKIKCPLKHGWRRETIVREVHKNGIKGDVIYYSPCGKKMRTFQEIERYLTKYEKEMDLKSIKLSRENFTFSSKILLGVFLSPKSNSSTEANGCDDADKLNKDLKFDILTEEQITARILALNPNFRLNGLSAYTAKPSGPITIKNMAVGIESNPMPTVLKLENTFAIQNNNTQDNNNNHLISTSTIYDFNMSNNEQVFKEQMNSRFEKHQQEQRELKEQQRQEKLQFRERKSREKWFEYIMAREQNPSNQRHINQYYINNECPEIFENSNRANRLAFDSIDDMQEKYGKSMPEFKPIKSTENYNNPEDLDNSSISTSSEKQANEDDQSWLADSLQVIEFLVTFSDKLKESLIEADDNNAAKIEDFSTVLSSLEQFRLGIENKTEKLKREIIQIVQLLLKCLLNAITQEADTPNDNKTSVVDTTCKDFYLINKLKNIECSDLTYSEILRLYIKRSFVFLEARRKLTANKFDTDVTGELYKRLDNYLDKLRANTFEYLEPTLKASIMAYLCDELLSTSPIEDLNNLHNQELIDYDNLDDYSCVVYDLNDAIDEFHAMKQEICQLDAKRRQVKTERSVANNKLVSIENALAVTSTKSVLNENGQSQDISVKPQVTEKEKIAQQKCVGKLDKALGQLEKKRAELKVELDKCSNRLRSGKHLGQDRYLRHYWSLSSTGAIMIQAADEATKPGSMYYSDDSRMLVTDPVELDVKEIIEEVLDKVLGMPEDELKSVDKYAHVIERQSADNPFKITFNSQHPDVNKLSFRQLEQLVRDQIQHKRPQPIDGKYLNEPSGRSKWWLCDNEVLFKQLIDCLSKRGYREKDLLKNLVKFNEEYLHLLPSSWNSEEISAEAKDKEGESNVVFEKLKSMVKDFSQNDGANVNSGTSKKQHDVQVYREQMKALKYVYALEDRVFSANLQQAASKDKQNRKNLQEDNGSVGDETSEQPIDVAVERLCELEQRIERRYLKYPFVPKKKLTHLKKKLLLKKQQRDEEEESGEEENEGDHAEDAMANGASGEYENGEAEAQSAVEEMPVVTSELQKWRELAASCKTTAQLYILVDELNNSIAWDKSIMKVICQICNSDSNEDKLLLCDNCDRGNHTYCFKPRLDEIPDGDWYCFVCIGILSDGQKLCCVCGSNEPFCPYESTNPRGINNDLNKCDKCAKCFHGQCMPQAKNYKTTRKWNCLNCSNTKPIITKVLKQNLHVNNADKTKETTVETVTNTGKRQNANEAKKSTKRLKRDEPPATIASPKKITNGGTTNSLPKKSLSKATAKKSNNKRKAVTEVDKETEHNSSLDESRSENKFNSSEQENSSVVSGPSSAKSSKKSAASKKQQAKGKKPVSEPLKVNVKTMAISSPPATPPNHVVKPRDLNMCLTIINEMGKTEAAKPFLVRVDEANHPDYYKHIKHPMDINTIKEKLKDKAYKTKEQFAYDCRLIFDNCEFFNEDNSKIGLAGHKLRAYFETKWMKVFD